MKVTIKASKINMGLLKKLEAAGITVTLIMTSAAGATQLTPKETLQAAKAKLEFIADQDPDSFDMDALKGTGTIAYMCDVPVFYSHQVDELCALAKSLGGK